MFRAEVILTKLLFCSGSSRQARFFPVLTAAIFIVIVAVLFPVPADSSIGGPDAEAAAQQNKEFDETGVPAPTHSLIDDPEAEAALQLNEPVADSLPIVQPKSLGKAFLFSAVVPGTGEFYSGAKRGVLFAAAEVAFWAAYIVFHGDAEELEEDYLKFCDEHILFEEDSPASSTKNWTLEDYEHATQSDNWHYVYTESSGKPVERVGKFYWDDLPEDMIDQPGDKPIAESQSKHRVEAFGKRGSTNDKFKQAKAFLGLVVFNHIISAIDAKIAATSYNNRISEPRAEISFHPTVSPSGHLGAYLTLHRRF